jgi:hypothetical protein
LILEEVSADEMYNQHHIYFFFVTGKEGRACHKEKGKKIQSSSLKSCITNIIVIIPTCSYRYDPQKDRYSDDDEDFEIRARPKR